MRKTISAGITTMATVPTLDAIKQGLAPTAWGATEAGDYEIAAEISTDGFYTSTVLFDDGYQPIPVSDEYSNVEHSASHNLTVNKSVDTDEDGIANHLDIDSDNDGIPDVREGSTAAPLNADTDGDGIDDAFDADNGGTPAGNVDYDDDGTPDYLDRDSDDDGITDTYEAGGTDADGDGEIDNFTDNNSDGMNDATVATPLPTGDFDSDDIPNFRDTRTEFSGDRL